jgi:1-acyl-sn-glycerol-3-phosphate acyltransferase
MAYEGLRQIFKSLMKNKIREVSGKENLPQEPPFIVAANHVGFLDAVALVILFLERYHHMTYFITRYKYWRMFGGPLARGWVGMIPVNIDKKKDSLADAIATVKQGNIMGIFPEATRNVDNQHLLKGKTGAIRLALATGAPLIPAGIVNTTGHRFRHVLKRIWQKDTYIAVSFGQAVDLSEFRGKSIDKPLLEAATKKLMLSIGNLCGKTYSY